MSNKFIRIAALLEKKHKAGIAAISSQEQQLLEQLEQVELLNQHSQKVVSFSPEENVYANDFKQAMYYRENLNTLLVEQRKEISNQRKLLRSKEQELQKELHKTSIINKFGEKQLTAHKQQIEQVEEEEIKSTVLLMYRNTAKIS